MSNVLAYKGYFAPVEFNAEQHVLTGMVAGIRDAIVFEGSTAEEVEQCFHDAVDDYLEFCAEKGREPERAFKGSFNVRTGSELHKQAALAAAKKGESLNKPRSAKVHRQHAVETCLGPRLRGDDAAEGVNQAV